MNDCMFRREFASSSMLLARQRKTSSAIHHAWKNLETIDARSGQYVSDEACEAQSEPAIDRLPSSLGVKLKMRWRLEPNKLLLLLRRHPTDRTSHTLSHLWRRDEAWRFG